ncbi:hypothetical protein TKWG_25824 (plasmid) [Advenella kashmirensis WT001]|uniref:SecDF P1 head subdomain domain-containing protein n=1 Tax=Advenella kashmirensis (strain DSM 17095 / LMG 22695 / WT001) TaxID=1036672 RepID=I3UI32_ADVKW|nr:hypothetical protein [Advenella kashmirensis]AFK64670.1 hypothetical protein TKWG_25824 [Advenella kashmirensis WT001]
MLKEKTLIAVLGILIFLAGCQQFPAQKRMPPAAPSSSMNQPVQSSVSFVLAQTRPVANLPTLKLGNKTVYYLPRAVLVRNDLTQMAVQKTTNGTSFVSFRLNQNGANKLASATANNKGRMLLLVLNNKVRGAVKINDTLSNGVVNIIVASENAAEDIVQLIR